MDKEQALELITKYKKGLCSEEEMEILNQWIDEQGHGQPNYQFQSDEQENRLKEDIRFQIKSSLFAKKKKSDHIHLQSILKIAAMLLLVSAIGIWGWNKYSGKQPEQYTSIYNPAGQLKTITLPDGSRVFLNAATRISFPSKFNTTTREVTLIGEAYFEVVHNPEKPFLIYTGKVKTQVLGTSFNVKAYANEPKIMVAVTSGKVGVVAGKSSALLIPNQTADYYIKDGKLLKSTITNASTLKAWTNGTLIFRDQTLNEITRTLIRRYNTNIIIQNNRIAESILNAHFDKNESLENVISVLCTYVDARYKREGTTYLIR
ncbi:FecR family protein [Mucilaginibacter sp. NFX135]|uniref:FecR family protein n=1 Tax=Mucilaginibacter sp. NFX135 TaxID=3402687 RepID=UPI003AFA4E46